MEIFENIFVVKKSACIENEYYNDCNYIDELARNVDNNDTNTNTIIGFSDHINIKCIKIISGEITVYLRSYKSIITDNDINLVMNVLKNCYNDDYNKIDIYENCSVDIVSQYTSFDNNGILNMFRFNNDLYIYTPKGHIKLPDTYLNIQNVGNKYIFYYDENTIYYKETDAMIKQYPKVFKTFKLNEKIEKIDKINNDELLYVKTPKYLYLLGEYNSTITFKKFFKIKFNKKINKLFSIKNEKIYIETNDSIYFINNYFNILHLLNNTDETKNINDRLVYNDGYIYDLYKNINIIKYEDIDKCAYINNKVLFKTNNIWYTYNYGVLTQIEIEEKNDDTNKTYFVIVTSSETKENIKNIAYNIDNKFNHFSYIVYNYI